MSTVIPRPTEKGAPSLVDAPVTHVEMGVLIGVTGQVRGRMLLVAQPDNFGGIAEAMFGMRLEGDMLESFVGELGNMVAGTMSTNVSHEGISIDITPPTVIVGDTKFTGFHKALSVPIVVQGVGEIRILLIMEE